MSVPNNIPSPSVPFLRSDGQISQVWWQFFITLYTRTGGGQGTDISGLTLAIAELQTDAASTENVQDDSLRQRIHGLEAVANAGTSVDIEALHQRIRSLEMQIEAIGIGSAGGASGPTPAGYINVNAANTTRKIAYY